MLLSESNGRRSVLSILQMLFEFLSLPQIVCDEAELLEVENEEALTNAIQADKGVILLAMHSGNWELISAYAKPILDKCCLSF